MYNNGSIPVFDFHIICSPHFRSEKNKQNLLRLERYVAFLPFICTFATTNIEDQQIMYYCNFEVATYL